MVRQWPSPTNAHELRSFLGIANFFRRSVRRFAHIASPLHALTSSKATWRWDEEQEAAFDALKCALSSAPVVVPPDPTLPYTVYTDASDRQIGAVLTQDRGNGPQVIAFESHDSLAGPMQLLRAVGTPPATQHPLHVLTSLTLMMIQQ